MGVHSPAKTIRLVKTTVALERPYFWSCVNRFYPKTQLSWLARLDHSHCNSADPLTDGLEVCCVFRPTAAGGCTVCVAARAADAPSQAFGAGGGASPRVSRFAGR